MQDVIFKDTEGNLISGTVSIPKYAKSVVIISHGFQSNRKSKLYVNLQDTLNNIGIGTLRYDYYGHGELYCKSTKYTVTKDVTLTKCVHSLKAAISFVNNYGDFHIGLAGASFGGLISLVVAAQDSTVKALALKSAVTEPVDFWKKRLSDERIEEWKQTNIMHYDEHDENFELLYNFWEDLLTYDTMKLAKNVNCPTLIIHGGSDTVVPIEQSNHLAKIIGSNVNVVEGANHNYATPEQYAAVKKLITAFFKKELY